MRCPRLLLLALGLVACGSPQPGPAVAVAPVPPPPSANAPPTVAGKTTEPASQSEGASADDEAIVEDGDRDASSIGARKGWLGVELEAVGGGTPGVRVMRVIPRSPADQAGLTMGDVIERVDNQAVRVPSELVALISAKSPGSKVALMVKRGGGDRLLGATLGAFPQGDELVRMTFVDQPAPAFDALEVAQGSVTPTLGAQRGKVVLLEFWASWCVACRAMIPHMNQWHAQYQGRGLRVIGVTNERVARASLFARQLGMEFFILADPSSRTIRNYQASTIPAIFLIDRQGTVRDVMVGYDSRRLAQLDNMVQRLIAEP